MAAEEPGPIPRGLLDRLASRPDGGGSHADARPQAGASSTDASLLGSRSEREASRTDASLLAADLAVLQDSGYLKLALPTRFGGAGLSLADLACAQRQLAARAPGAAWAVNAHHAWVGAAADTLGADALATDARPGGPGGAAWVLGEAARGRVFAGFGAGQGPGYDLETPGWDWRAGLSLDRWPVAEASLRLDHMRGGLDEVIASWRQRVAAGGGVTSLDPGRLGLVRQFTARHVATDGARHVLDLARLIAGHPVGATR